MSAARKLPDGATSARLILRPLEADITPDYLSWFDDETVVQFLEVKGLKRQDSIDFLHRGDQTGLYRVYAICWRDTGEHIGNIKLGEIRWQHGVSDLVTVIGNRTRWAAGLGQEAIRLGTSLAFDQVGLRKLAGAAYADNVGSIKAYTRAGWVVEGWRRGHVLSQGKSTDMALLSCFNPKFFPEPPDLPPQPEY